jgi:hypothetical protein
LSTEAPKDSRIYLEDMEDCISKILAYTEGLSLKQFCGDRKTVLGYCQDRPAELASNSRARSEPQALGLL